MGKLIIVLCGWAFTSAAVLAEDASARLETYLKAEFPARIEQVSVGEKEIVISGMTDRAASLVAVPMEQPTAGPVSGEFFAEIKPGAFRVTVPRGDRLTQR